jgi:glycosyltransferase involved in cell wall biosynthesis
MRILFVSNLYPPHYLGGYEFGCYEAANQLKNRGHEVRILASSYGVGSPEFDGEVYRWLEADLEQPARSLGQRAVRVLKKEIRNQRAFKRVAREFRPDLVYFWNLRTISISIAFWAQRKRIRSCFYVFDKWLETWRKDQWYSLWPPAPRNRLVKLASGALRWLLETAGIVTTESLNLDHVQFASHFLKDALLQRGETIADAEVIHWGIEVDKCLFQQQANPERLLFAGQTGAHKGVHTAIEALRILVNEHGLSDLSLTIAGSGPDREYESELHRLAQAGGIEQNIRFTGFVTRDRLPELYGAHGLLLFPSIVDEGLGLSMLEAMASGLAVVGTASGGSAEILEHEKTGLVFPKEDARGCAAQVLRLVNDRELFEQLRRGGRQIVEQEFTIDRAIESIERSLLSQLDQVNQDSG